MLEFRWISESQLDRIQNVLAETMRQWVFAWSPHKDEKIICDRLDQPDLNEDFNVFQSPNAPGHWVVVSCAQSILDLLFCNESIVNDDSALLQFVADKSVTRLTQMLHDRFSKQPVELQRLDKQRYDRVGFENENLITWFSLGLGKRRIQVGISNALLTSNAQGVQSIKGLYRRDELLSSESVELNVSLCLGAVPLQSIHGLRVGDIITSGTPLQSAFVVSANQRALFKASLVAVNEQKAINILGKGE